MSKYLNLKIAELTERLQRLDRDRIETAASLRAYQDALQHEVDDKGSREDRAAVAPVTRPSSSAFEMSKDWLNVMRQLCNRKFKAIDMVMIGRDNGFATKTENARSQLMFYEKKKYVRRVDRGVYTVTPEGKAVFQNAEGSADPSKSSGEVAASPGTGD